MKTIFERRLEIEKQRRTLKASLLTPLLAYDREVYYPARRQLRAECATEGHSPFRSVQGDKVFNYCSKCGGSV